MKTRYSLLLLGTVLVLAANGSSSAAEERPNVIVIMTDDQGNNVGFQGNPHVTTPHIDKLAEQSVRLTNFHQMPMCTASRAALMTGKYAEQTGAWRTSLGRTLMRGDNFTSAEAFRQNGYATGHFGKWHLGDNWPMRPQTTGRQVAVSVKRSLKGTAGTGSIWRQTRTVDNSEDGRPSPESRRPTRWSLPC